MSLRIRTFSMALVAMSAASQVYALPSDDSENKEKKEERNVMLNASDANKPREIQIGLPSEDVTVYENGLPFSPCFQIRQKEVQTLGLQLTSLPKP